MTKLWARLGVSIHAEVSDIEELKSNPEKAMVRLIQESKVYLDGDFYFPLEDENNEQAFKKEVGGDLNQTQLSIKKL
jgi:hypothetical protein